MTASGQTFLSKKALSLVVNGPSDNTHRKADMKILINQALPTFGKIAANVTTVEQTCQIAASLNVDVVVFPELFLSGYNLGPALGNLAIPSDGDVIAKLRAVAKSNHVAIIVGFPEQLGDAIFNTAIVISRDGDVAAIHRKVFLFGNTEKQQFQRGDNFPVFVLAGRICGLSICYDIEFPEVSRSFKKRGAEIIFVPTANMVPYYNVPTTLVRARALENSLVVVYVNLTGTEGNQTYTGQSCIIAPDGNDIVRAGSDPAILVADVGPAIARNVERPFSTQLEDLNFSNGSL